MTGRAPLTTVRLEPMRAEHLPVILALEEQLFGGEAWTEGMLRDELAAPESRHYVVALIEAEIVGYAGLVSYDHEAHVTTIGVVPGRRCRGVGTAMLADLLSAAGVRRVLLEVEAGNAAAQRLYARNGFTPVGLRRRYYRSTGADAVVMARA
ncbi:MAG: ribosomal protein S18-alanine N-acetyltransferase [Geodermatophilaceae bacterium]|nr:ribosomal protein S18-alanine N-acetyltransferase [Geodermatophilaceae bacterium]MDQ3455343.1 ribosomal protein S18-alanine N-acetyltransferase [Actinomycetota bacterium]